MDDDITSTSQGRSPTIDLWVNALSDEGANDFAARPGNEHITDLLGGDLSAASTPGKLIATMPAMWGRMTLMETRLEISMAVIIPTLIRIAIL